MPIMEGRGPKKHSDNVGEMMRSYRSKGKIGTTKPRSYKHAEEIANAISFDKRREAGEDIPKA